MKNKHTTVKEICEFIAKTKILTRDDGTHPNAKEIFNYSPSGELYKLWEWSFAAFDYALNSDNEELIKEAKALLKRSVNHRKPNQLYGFQPNKGLYFNEE